MLGMEIDARLDAGKARIDKLEQELKALAESGIDYALAKYHLMNDNIVSTKSFIQELETDYP